MLGDEGGYLQRVSDLVANPKAARSGNHTDTPRAVPTPQKLGGPETKAVSGALQAHRSEAAFRIPQKKPRVVQSMGRLSNPNSRFSAVTLATKKQVPRRLSPLQLEALLCGTDVEA